MLKINLSRIQILFSEYADVFDKGVPTDKMLVIPDSPKERSCEENGTFLPLIDALTRASEGKKKEVTFVETLLCVRRYTNCFIDTVISSSQRLWEVDIVIPLS